MRPQGFDMVSVVPTVDGHTVRLQQTNAKLRAGASAALMGVLAALIVVPQVALAVCALIEPQARAALSAHPASALQLALALAVWIGLVCWPLRKFILRAGLRRQIEIGFTGVAIRDDSTFGTRLSRESLSNFLGYAKHARTTHSGIRNELMLVHADAAKSLFLLALNDTASAAVETRLRDLGLTEVPARDLYRLPLWMGARPRPVTAEPLLLPSA